MPKKKPGKTLKKKAKAKEKPACQHCCEHKKLKFEEGSDRVICKACFKTWGTSITINPPLPYRDRPYTAPTYPKPYWFGKDNVPDFTPTIWCDASTTGTLVFNSDANSSSLLTFRSS